MEKAKKDVGQKIRRIKHNLVKWVHSHFITLPSIFSSSKKEEDDDLRIIHNLEARNTKMMNVIQTYKKNVSNTIKTGFKEENVDKRRAIRIFLTVSKTFFRKS